MAETLRYTLNNIKITARTYKLVNLTLQGQITLRSFLL